MPRAEYQVSEDYDTRTKPRYCQWQLLYVKDAVSLVTAEVSLDWLLDDDRRATLGEGYRSWYSKREEQRRSLHDQRRTLVLLLVRLQSRYAPLIKGTLTKAPRRSSSTWRLATTSTLSTYATASAKSTTHRQPQRANGL